MNDDNVFDDDDDNDDNFNHSGNEDNNMMMLTMLMAMVIKVKVNMSIMKAWHSSAQCCKQQIVFNSIYVQYR